MHNPIELILKVQILGDYQDVNNVIDLIVEGAKVKGNSEIIELLQFAGYVY